MKKTLLILFIAIGLLLAFSSCKAEEIPEWFTVEGNTLVKYTGNEKVVEIPDGIVTIANEAFCGNDAIEEVEFSDSVRIIGIYAFGECTALKTVTFNDGVMEIRDGAFANCKNITEINIPETVTFLGYGTFAGTSIEHLKIPGGVDYVRNVMGTVKDYGVNEDTSLKILEIGDGVNAISGFDNCKSLHTVILPDSLEVIGGFDNCTKLINIALPEGLREVGGFKGCEQLVDIKIPSTVTIFDALRNTSFWERDDKFMIVGDGVLVWIKTDETSVTLPEEVNIIGTTVETRYQYSPENDIFSPQLEEIIIVKPLERIDSDFYGHNPPIRITENY